MAQYLQAWVRLKVTQAFHLHVQQLDDIVNAQWDAERNASFEADCMQTARLRLGPVPSYWMEVVERVWMLPWKDRRMNVNEESWSETRSLLRWLPRKAEHAWRMHVLAIGHAVTLCNAHGTSSLAHRPWHWDDTHIHSCLAIVVDIGCGSRVNSWYSFSMFITGSDILGRF